MADRNDAGGEIIEDPANVPNKEVEIIAKPAAKAPQNTIKRAINDNPDDLLKKNCKDKSASHYLLLLKSLW